MPINPAEVAEYLGKFKTEMELYEECAFYHVQGEPGIPSCCAIAKLIQFKFRSDHGDDYGMQKIQVFPLNATLRDQSDGPRIEFGDGGMDGRIPLPQPCADFALGFDSEKFPDLIDPEWLEAEEADRDIPDLEPE